MPLYCYQCRECGNEYDLFLPLKDWELEPACPDCGGPGKKLITAQIQRDEPTWLNDDVRDVLQDREDPDTRHIETRCDYNRHLKENGIIER